MTATRETMLTHLSADELGGPGVADPTKCAGVAIAMLGGAAGEGFALSSLSLEMAHGRPAGEVELRIRIDKRTRAVVFSTLEAWSGGEMVFSARGLFTKAD
jgi:hypothetical protein